MASVFTKIIRGEIPCYKVAEDAYHIAFLDIRPLTEGHTLVVPKKETDYIFDLEDDELVALHLFSKKTALAIQKAIPCTRIGMTVIGLEVPHTHIHLIPINTVDDMNFSRAKRQLLPERFQEIADRIASFY